VSATLTNRVLCVVQARTGSTRLPGKVLQPIAGRPMLGFMLDRLAGLAVDDLVVATSDLYRDDPIAEIAREVGVAVVRGSESDVLARFGTALDRFPADHVVRLTADCPLSDPRLIEAVIATHLRRGADYTSNVLPRTFPKGLDVEVVSAAALRAAIDEARATDEREHVTPFVYRRPERFRLTNHNASVPPLGAEWWTVDTAADLEFVRCAVERVGRADAPWTEILRAVGCRAPVRPGALFLRPATVEDSERLLAWRNDADSVRWSTTALPVAENEHEAWFGRVLPDAGRRIWIGEVDGVAVGMVRVDVREAVGTVSVAVDPQRRGHGAGSVLVRALQRELLGDCQVVELRALVHPANAGSQRIFQRAGFAEAGIDARTGFLTLRCPRAAF
jgi:spore coat polysaccharide biosynthesis protein SpsF